MKRKILAPLLVAALAGALMPALPASAAAQGSAQIVGGTETFPTDARTWNIRVDSTGASGLTGAPPINYVNIVLPVGTAGIEFAEAPPAPAGWEIIDFDDLGSLQEVSYRAVSESLTDTTIGIAGGSFATFPIPSTVNRPKRADLAGAFKVYASDDGGVNTTRFSGNLTAKVNVLELVTPLAVASKYPLALDGNMTETGLFGFDATVRNHAREDVDVNGVLSSVGPDLNVVPSKTHKIDAEGGTRTFTWDLEAAAAPNGNRTETFNVDFDSARASLDSNTVAFIIERKRNLNFAAVQPEVVRSVISEAGATAAEIEAATNTFTSVVTPSGSPGLTVTKVRMSFDGNIIDDTNPPASIARGGNANLTLDFGPHVVVGPDANDLQVDVLVDVTDDNGISYVLEKTAGTIDINNNIPIFDRIEVVIPEGQTAVKHGDTIAVRGVVESPVSLDINTLMARLDPSRGDEQDLDIDEVSALPGHDDPNGRDTDPGYVYIDCSDPLLTCFTGQAAYTWTSNNLPDDTFDGETVDVYTSVQNTVGAVGEGVAPLAFRLDTVVPALDGTAFTTSYTPAGGGPTTGAIALNINETSSVFDGCDINNYRVGNGVTYTIAEVRAGNSAECDDTSTASLGGSRLLVLNQVLSPTDDPGELTLLGAESPVRNFSPYDPPRDGAGNIEDLDQVADILIGVLPAPPTILEDLATRHQDAPEAAYYESGDPITFFTRDITDSSGASDFEIVVSGAVTGWTLEVLAADGETAISSNSDLDGDGADNISGTDDDGIAAVRVPIGDVVDQDNLPGHETDGSYTRFVRFVNESGTLGFATEFTVVLDTVKPALTNAFEDAGVVTLDFTDQLVTGSTFARYWRGWYAATNNDGETVEDFYAATSVETPDDRTTLIINFENAGNEFIYVGYRYRADGGIQFADRAGNVLEATL